MSGNVTNAPISTSGFLGVKNPASTPERQYTKGGVLFMAKITGQVSPVTCAVFISEVAEPAVETPRRKISAQDTVGISSLSIIKHVSTLIFNPSSLAETTGVKDPASILWTAARWKRRKELDTVESIQRAGGIGRPPA